MPSETPLEKRGRGKRRAGDVPSENPARETEEDEGKGKRESSAYSETPLEAEKENVHHNTKIREENSKDEVNEHNKVTGDLNEAMTFLCEEKKVTYMKR